MARRRELLEPSLFAELDLVKVYECSLRCPDEQVEGMQCGDSIYVDPRLSVIDTVAHELFHRRHPEWSERRVRLETRRLIGGMDDRTKQKWWRKYQKVKRRGRPVDA